MEKADCHEESAGQNEGWDYGLVLKRSMSDDTVIKTLSKPSLKSILVSQFLRYLLLIYCIH